MKYSEIKDLEAGELENKRTELRTKLFEMRMKNSLGQLGNQVEIRTVRKDIARIETVLSSKKAVTNG